MAKPQDTEWQSGPRTLLKHQIYRRYVHCWMGKILQGFPTATIVDAFAGPGRYSDGPQGSSIVIANAFLEHSGRDRFHTLQLVCSEKGPARRDALAQRIAALPTHPHLQPQVLPAQPFAEAYPVIDEMAHREGTALPTLWVLDPFDVKSLPFELVRRCLRRSKDEVLVTWFADEIYRFCTVPEMQMALDMHYGDSSWRTALDVDGEHRRKNALLSAYQRRLESLPGVRTGALSIAVKNESPRYSIILATHSDKGLECWNPVKWGLDPSTGRTVSERRGPQEALFDERSALREALRARTGSARRFAELRTEATRLGFTEAQLRSTLTELGEDGIAVRQWPLDTNRRSPWPDDCVVRFYPEGADEGPRPHR